MRLATAIIPVILIVGLAAGAMPTPQNSTIIVKGSVTLSRSDGAAAKKSDNANAVVWLKPAIGAADRQASARPAATRSGRFKVVQQNKRFDPHILVIPVGSTVDFPNLDPFFHNVFSMFDGKRFDLGLYEAGASHTVKFDAAGICYVFCNIHPDMSAAIVVVDTPFFATTNMAGDFSIPDVPPGTYMVSVWHERGTPAKSDVFPRQMTISTASAVIPAIRLQDGPPLLVPHKNKYGKDYDPATPDPTYK